MTAGRLRSCSSSVAAQRAICITAGLLFALATATADPLADTRAWQTRRNTDLRNTEGWLALAGLFPLRDGELALGSAADNDIEFPALAPAQVGILTVASTVLRFQASAGVAVRHGDKRITSVDLLSDEAPDGPTRLQLGTLSWWVIERVGRRWLRLSDREHPTLRDPHPLEHFPISNEWRVPARLQRVPDAPAVAVPTVLGVPSLQVAAGVLQFELSGRQFRLRALDGDNGRLFVIFADATNGTTTYGAGRFLWADAPDEAGHTQLDFNRAYNPPCAFTPFATCPLPPPGNTLDLEVMAGEKNWAGTAH